LLANKINDEGQSVDCAEFSEPQEIIDSVYDHAVQLLDRVYLFILYV